MQNAHSATASIGKFQRRIPNEKIQKPKNTKRKIEEVFNGGEEEKNHLLEIAKKVKKQELNLDSAINKQIKSENVM